MSKKPTSRDTKAKILKEYDQLFDENKKLLSQIEQIKKERESLEKKIPLEKKVAQKMDVTEPAKKDVQDMIETKEKSSAETATMEHIIEGLQSIRSGFAKAVNELSARLVAEASTLAELQHQVNNENEQLKLLFDLEVTNETLDQLLLEYTEKSKVFEQETQQKQQAFDKAMLEKNKSWQKEQQEHDQIVKERNDSADLNLSREEAEYRYNLEQQRKMDKDEFDLKLKKLHRELDSIENETKKEWSDREKVIIEKEKEFDELKERVEKFPKELETAIKDAKTKASQSVQRDAQIKADLRSKEVQGEKQVYETKIKSLEDTVKNQLQQIQALSSRLDATLKQSQALAMKAIEGASNVSSFQSVREIAMEQAKKMKSE